MASHYIIDDKAHQNTKQLNRFDTELDILYIAMTLNIKDVTYFY